MSAQRTARKGGAGGVLGLVRPAFVILMLALLPVAAVQRALDGSHHRGAAPEMTERGERAEDPVRC